MEFLEHYKNMRDTVKEIEDLDKHLNYNLGYYSQIVIDLFENIIEEIDNNSFNAGGVLYKVETLLEVFSRVKVKDIELLEQLKEKLERLTVIVL